MDELQTLINEVQIATSDLAVFISGKGIDKLVFKQVLSDDEYESSKAEVLAGLKDPTEIGTIQEWSLLFKAESKNKELKAKLIRTEAKAKHEKLKQLKKMVGVMTKTLQSGAASEYKARPMVAPAIDSAEPKAWLGQKDKRTIRTFIEEVETFVTVTKCVPVSNQKREIARLSMALMKGQEAQLVAKDFAAWRKSQAEPLNSWPETDTLMRWMNESK